MNAPNSQTKERPILFSAPMVRALLDGSKTQTRRVVKPQPPTEHTFAGFTTSSTHKPDEGKAVWGRGDTRVKLIDAHRVRHPYGEPGERLWVREAFRVSSHFDSSPPRNIPTGAEVWHEATSTAKEWRSNVGKQRPGIFMPRWASRITLEVTAVRVERLQDISNKDALAEGIAQHPDGPWHAYQSLWTLINGPESWEANPWVWVVEFKRLEGAAA